MPPNPILICAPSDELRQRLEGMLHAAGYATSVALSPAEAVAILRDAKIDLIVAEGLAVSGAIPIIRGASPTRAPLLVIAPAGEVEARIALLEAEAGHGIHAALARHDLEDGVGAVLLRSG